MQFSFQGRWGIDDNFRVQKLNLHPEHFLINTLQLPKAKNQQTTYEFSVGSWMIPGYRAFFCGSFHYSWLLHKAVLCKVKGSNRSETVVCLILQSTNIFPSKVKGENTRGEYYSRYFTIVSAAALQYQAKLQLPWVRGWQWAHNCQIYKNRGKNQGGMGKY